MAELNFGSVASGIEAASVAWRPLGWKAKWLSEIAPFPCRVLQHHYPDIPNLGDMTKLLTNKKFLDEKIDLLVGGTPCQSFSVAGFRNGLDDERGNLSLEFVRILFKKRCSWFVWENVPGVLSSGKNTDGSKCPGKDFAAILSAWTGQDIAPQKFRTCGIIEGKSGSYSAGWRVLDSQYFGVPQRRRRVFVVGHIGDDWRPLAAVLFERESLQWNNTEIKKKQKEVAEKTNRGFGGNNNCGVDGLGEFWDGSQTCQTLDAVLHKGQTMPEKNRFPAVIQPVIDSELYSIVPANSGKDYRAKKADVVQTITGQGQSQSQNQGGNVLITKNIIRRLTPLECERLQGFPDGYTNIPGAKDSPRYKALGNSMTTNVMTWIGQRISAVQDVWEIT